MCICVEFVRTREQSIEIDGRRQKLTLSGPVSLLSLLSVQTSTCNHEAVNPEKISHHRLHRQTTCYGLTLYAMHSLYSVFIIISEPEIRKLFYWQRLCSKGSYKFLFDSQVFFSHKSKSIASLSACKVAETSDKGTLVFSCRLYSCTDTMFVLLYLFPLS